AVEPTASLARLGCPGSVHGLRLRAMHRAEALGNVRTVRRELGISRAPFYRWRKRYERSGADGVRPRRQRGRPGRPAQALPEVERVVLSVAISAATSGRARIATHLRRTWRAQCAPSTAPRLLRRVGLATRRAPPTVLERQVARAVGLTERIQQPLWRARHGHTGDVQASEPVCLGTFYVGNLKGLGKVWPGTILQEHWRVAFRRGYLTNRGALQRSLDQLMRYYNRDRPDQGYRLRGRPRRRCSWEPSVPNCTSHSGIAEVSPPFESGRPRFRTSSAF